MSIQFKSIYPEKSRTASPDDSEAIEIAATGANYVRAIWRLVSGSGGSSDQTGNLKAQHSNDTVDWDDKLSDQQRLLMCDAQTSGGLLISVPKAKLDQLLSELAVSSVETRAVVGEITAENSGRIRVTA